MNLWTRAGKAALCLKGIKIDVSGERNLKIIVKAVSCISWKAVRVLHTALRQRQTSGILDASQGRFIKGLDLKPFKDITALTSCRTSLSFEDWHYIHRSRLVVLPVLGRPGSKSTVKTCRQGCYKAETSQHVISACQVNLNLCTARHDSLLDLMAAKTRKLGTWDSIRRLLRLPAIQGMTKITSMHLAFDPRSEPRN